MPVITEFLHVKTEGNTDIINITNAIEAIIKKHEIKEGMMAVSVIGSTASITNIEYEPGLLLDFPEMLEKIAPSNIVYNHDKKWHDANGYAHLRASLLGNSKNYGIYNNELQIGMWQQIILVDFDNKPRVRKVVLQVVM